MRYGQLHPDFLAGRAGGTRRAFTLIEMLVALAILVIMMGAIGEVFHLAGHSVRFGQATLSTMAQVRVIEHQISTDFHEMDTNGFLVIRQQDYVPSWDGNSIHYNPGDEVATGGVVYICTSPNVSNANNTPQTLATENIDWQPITNTSIPIWRADQISFIANGNFHSRAGNTQGATNSLLSSNSALIWLGQMAVSYGRTAPLESSLSSTQLGWPAYFPEGNSSGGTYVQLGTPPTGLTAGSLTLGRVVMLLVPNNLTSQGAPTSENLITGIGPAATGNASYGTGSTTVYATSSRLDAMEYSAAQAIAYATSQAAANGLENVADNFCFRYSTVQSPGDASVAGPIAGAFRMQPILMPGVCSFAVDVGSTLPNEYSSNTSTGTSTTTPSLYWFGPRAITPGPNGSTGPFLASGGSSPSEHYVFVFTPANKAAWPVALRITYMVTDPADQLNGPLTVTQIVHLPQ
jgi:prepilin-type N-terminal cleavage/methylation domain-containing protein